MNGNAKKVDAKMLEKILIRENKFLEELFSVVPIPSHEQKEDVEEAKNGMSEAKKVMLPQTKTTTRAKSITELQERLQAIQSKKRLTYKEKLMKKGLKNRMKKKLKQNERNAKQKLVRAEKLTKKEQNATETKQDDKSSKPVYTPDDKMVFSKFDFSGVGKKKRKKELKDPEKILKKLKEQKEKIAELAESGEQKKAIEIKEKIDWKNALAKAEGRKVKDDPQLLKKSIEKKKQRVKSSKKKWEARQEAVKKAQEERQKKRTENIQKRKKEKKLNKLKKAAKKGKIIPGF